MQSEANLDQLSSKENGLASLDINGTTEKNILESQRAVTGMLQYVNLKVEFPFLQAAHKVLLA